MDGDEEGREDAGNDGLPGDADVGADGCEEQVESRDEGGGESVTADVLLLEDAGEHDGEGSDANAGELVRGEGCVAGDVSLGSTGEWCERTQRKSC